jgi:hypothetical protein
MENKILWIRFKEEYIYECVGDPLNLKEGDLLRFKAGQVVKAHAKYKTSHGATCWVVEADTPYDDKTVHINDSLAEEVSPAEARLAGVLYIV